MIALPLVVLVLLTWTLPGLAKIARTAPAVDRIIVYKHQRKLAFMAEGKEIKVYRIGLGTEPVGAKQRQGDHRTPEGVYVLDARNDQSHYYKSLHISYPAAQDIEFARKHGVPAGGDIMLHGTPAEFAPPKESDPPYDWTDGCIAVRNREMDEVLRMVAVGTTIEIRP